MSPSFSTLVAVLVLTTMASNVSAGIIGDLINSTSALVTCKATLAANQFRCSPPQATQLEEPLGVSCQQDCVCVHGLTDGECVPEKDGVTKNCLCYDDPSQNATDLADLRNRICAGPIKAFATQTAVKGLCASTPLPYTGPLGQVPSCDADCRCGHKASGGGKCEANGLVVEGKSYDICRCYY